MNDEIIDEIHQIRIRLYEESQKMTPEERQAKTQVASIWVQQQIAVCREKNHSDNITNHGSGRRRTI